MSRPLIPGQKISDIRNRLGELRSYSAMRPKSPLQNRLLRPSLPGSVSITKIPRDPKKSDTDGNESSSASTTKLETNSEEDTQVLDSDEEDDKKQQKPKPSNVLELDASKTDTPEPPNTAEAENPPSTGMDKESKSEPEPLVLTTDEKLPSEDALENKPTEDKFMEQSSILDMNRFDLSESSRSAEAVERKINPLKNYRHQRPSGRVSLESSLSQLERTASVLNKEGMPDFRKNLDDITQSYSPTGEERPGTKPRKRRSPTKPDGTPEPQPMSVPGASPSAGPAPGLSPGPSAAPSLAGPASMTGPASLAGPPGPGMSHSVSSLLGPASLPRPRKSEPALPPGMPSTMSPSMPPSMPSSMPPSMSANPMDASLVHPRLMGRPGPHEPPHAHSGHMKSSPGMPLSMSHPAMMSGGTAVPADISKSMAHGHMPGGPPVPPGPPGQMYPTGNAPPEGPYAPQFPGKDNRYRRLW